MTENNSLAFFKNKKKIISLFFQNQIFKYGSLEYLLYKIQSLSDSDNYLSKKRLVESRFFYDQILSKINFNPNWIKNYNNPIYYRRVCEMFDPLDIAGSLSDGGRFNIGGSQASTKYSELFKPIGQKQACLYFAENPKIARIEFGDIDMLNSSALSYKITLKSIEVINLIELDLVLNDISTQFTNVAQNLNNYSINAKWGDIKYPEVTQILGHWLKYYSKGKAHGIRFKSSKDQNYYNICFYLKDTRQSHSIFNYEIIT